jgi:hypothetical protein
MTMRYPKNYGIPDEDLQRIRKRDQDCVYCRKHMPPRTGSSRLGMPTIEHMSTVEDGVRDPMGTVAICCHSCNASRKPPHERWFQTRYCRERNINFDTVAEPVQDFLTRPLAA